MSLLSSLTRVPAVLASVYPFLSQCIRDWAPSQVGDGQGDGGATYVSRSEWLAVTHTCFSPDSTLPSTTDQTVLALFHLISSLFVFIYAIGVLLPQALGLGTLNSLGRSSHGQLRKRIRCFWDELGKPCRGRVPRYVLPAVPVCLMVLLLREFWRLRGLQ
ncbi:hypothetical protein B0H67DRAFT_589230 [Lasiosphaeris hirsuta]|uniref:Uncharacterized protein n=1 Tax=Lasiosphaeris hirsuta TaxID=260670 RepID=A0AA40DLY6_9PEZI|nr:hypothetical protein B0H67DRAFT_589230 [Lasiosphaeris hirsuta]